MVTMKAIVYGGKGALGSVCINTLKSAKWWVCNVDLCVNDTADCNVVVGPVDSLEAQSEQVLNDLANAVGADKVDAVFCVAGGWAGGNASSKDFVKNTELVIKQSIWTSVIAARLASKHLKDGGILQLTGASPALHGTPGMIGYGMSKAAVHHLAKSLAADKSGMPDKSSVITILPITLDTPMNRKFMPNADHSKWTPLEFVANQLLEWAVSSPEQRPASGSLIELVTADGKTTLVER